MKIANHGCAGLLIIVSMVAPAVGHAQAGAGRGAGLRPPSDAAQVERGKALYGVRCTFCHGADARGGEGGPNLVRSGLVLNDINGESIAPVIQNGRPDAGMPKFDLTPTQISDIAGFLHTFKAAGRDPARNTPPNVLVGDAKAGQAYFKARCAACHSVTGDLKGLVLKIPDPKTLQQTWLMPGAGRAGSTVIAVSPKTVTVTVSATQKFEGRLERIDDFTVTLVENDGTSRTFMRDGSSPAVEVHDPLRPHKDLLPVYTDKDIHDVTAYLTSVK
ncbi:MAG TPA: c-type cytochrome [Bryobacteraceae bacterium]|nr:c-type cytochrome [Bryobacteraceae bacterium]